MKNDFDKSLAELEALTKKLEDPDMPLAESIELFNKGVALTKKCLESLDESKGKISLLTDEINGISKPFEPSLPD
ncbi:MAG: exodeoxyribonuclease VII small subunit [Clostridiales bacterium]|jgi:exodeoxyribonuclease VII small subunit|nr:exodeoxyribonuclease VII small subunit [Clostridiales bacterium]